MVSKKFEIFTTPQCGYCAKAKSLITEKGDKYDEKPLTPDNRLMLRHIGRTTVPVIFYNGSLIGGYDDLVEYYDHRNTRTADDACDTGIDEKN